MSLLDEVFVDGVLEVENLLEDVLHRLSLGHIVLMYLFLSNLTILEQFECFECNRWYLSQHFLCGHNFFAKLKWIFSEVTEGVAVCILGIVDLI